VARKPSPDEISLANQKDVELEITPVALDGFIFIVNAENPVSDLTTEDIQDIYTGKITNWKEVGGSDTEISAYQRNENSGSQELMKTLVMKDLEFQNNLGEMILYGMMGPINMISEDQQGLGYSVFYYKEFIAPNDKLKSIAVDGVKPTSDTISDQSYPYTTKVYAVIRKDLEVESSAYKMRNWLLTEEGQDIVEKSGYVAVE
jgi:phosphate transport system substrate-binding protein